MLLYGITELLLLLAQYARAKLTEGNSNDWHHHHGPHDNHDSYGQDCAAACTSLQSCPSLSVSMRNTIQFSFNKASYWSSFQSDVSPTCFVSPSSAEDVARIIKVLRKTSCPFAVKSGGHAAFTNASNAEAGVTILLEKLKTIELSENREILSVGTGNRWVDVYDFSIPKGLGVIGGRVAAIGTGGLTLGGGISFFSARYGWACDGARNYEVVTAKGEVLDVNRSSYPELYWALRGGGNNFGVVTRLDLETFQQGDIWGGSISVPWSERGNVVAAMQSFGERQSGLYGEGNVDVDAATWAVFGYIQAQNTLIASVEPVYARPEAEPAVFENFTTLEPVLASTVKVRNLTDLVEELEEGNPKGLRETYQTHSFLLKEEMMLACVEIWEEELEAVKDVEGILPVLAFQLLTTAASRHFSRNGGNALGISEADGPLLIMSVPTMWADTSRDAEVLRFARNVIERGVERSKELGAYHRYIYQNYAAGWQEVFEGYGEGNLERLRAISKEWDPDGVFQELQPGYFKLW